MIINKIIDKYFSIDIPIDRIEYLVGLILIYPIRFLLGGLVPESSGYAQIIIMVAVDIIFWSLNIFWCTKRFIDIKPMFKPMKVFWTLLLINIVIAGITAMNLIPQTLLPFLGWANNVILALFAIWLLFSPGKRSIVSEHKANIHHGF